MAPAEAVQRNLSYLWLQGERAELACVRQRVREKQGGLIFRSAFGRMISCKQIMLCLRRLFQG